MRQFQVTGEPSLITESQLVLHLGSEINEVDAQGASTKKTHWDDRIARLFACDCAEHVLGVFEHWHIGDKRPRQAIVVARRYANGMASDEDLSRACVSAGDAASVNRKDYPPYLESSAPYLDLYAYFAGRAAAFSAAANTQWGRRSADMAAAARSAAARDEKGTTINQSLAWINERAYQTQRLMRYLDGIA